MMRFMWIAAFSVFVGFTVPASSAEDLPDLTREQIEQIVREYLIDNPTVVVEALQAYERQVADEQARTADQAMSDMAIDLYGDPNTPETGNPDGDVVIVEFFDYRCGYCRRSAPDVFAVVRDDPNVRFIYKEFPILGPGSELAAKAALASRNQGLYQSFHEALMTADIDFSEESIMSVAELVGLDVDQLKVDMEGPEVAAHIEKTYELARALGIRGTPAFIVGDELIPGAVNRAELNNLIEQAREG